MCNSVALISIDTCLYHNISGSMTAGQFFRSEVLAHIAALISIKTLFIATYTCIGATQLASLSQPGNCDKYDINLEKHG